MKRIFIALPVPENIREKILGWQKEHSEFPVRWIKPENLHITIAPPWYVDENGLKKVQKILEKIVKNFKPFAVNFRKVLWGPPGTEPRLIWAEGGAPPEFAEIKEKTEKSLLLPKTGFLRKERRPVLLHLTVARFRPGAIKKFPAFEAGIDWKFAVNSLIIFESVLKRSGAEYAILEKYDFQK